MPPKETITNDQLIRLNERMERLISATEANFLFVQRKEAEKQPVNVQPYTVQLKCSVTPPTPLQIFPRNPNRRELSIYNVGPSTLLFNGEWFDPTTILEQFSDPSNPSPVLPVPNQLVKVGYLTSGAAVSWLSQSPVWLYNIANTGAVVSAFDTSFKSTIQLQHDIPGADGVLNGGYGVVRDTDGNAHMVKGLR